MARGSHWRFPLCFAPNLTSPVTHYAVSNKKMISEGTSQQGHDPMMHTNGSTAIRCGLRALTSVVFLFIGIAALPVRVEAQPRAVVANTRLDSVTIVGAADTDNVTVPVGI